MSDRVKIITESLSNVKYIQEGEGSNKELFIEGIFSTADIENKNGRKYHEETLKKQVESLQEDIKQNRLFGELNHPECYLYEEFQVLTDKGWKEFVDVNIGDKVYSVNENGKLVLNNVLNKTNEPYSGTAYRIKGRKIDSTVTPNHRFYLLDRHGNRIVRTAEELFKNGTDKLRIIKNVEYVPENEDKFIKIPGISGLSESETKRYKTDVSKDLFIPSDLFVKFLGFWLAEGHLSSNPASYSILVTQQEGHVLDEVKELYNEIGFDFNLREKRNFAGVRTFTISFSDRRLWEYLKPLGDCYSKYIPEEVKKLSPDLLEDLIVWFSKGDGRKYKFREVLEKECIENVLDVFTTSERLANDLQECLVKSGYSGRMFIREPNKDYIFDQHEIKAENKSPLYILSVNRNSGICLTNRTSMNIEEVVVEDSKACCLTTELGNFYIRDKGICYLTGNSIQVNPERYAILIKELKWEDGNIKGKAKVLGTPLGNIIKAVIDAGGAIGISSRGTGTVDEDGYVNDKNYKLITWDVVGNPSNSPSWMNGIYEGKEWEVSEDGKILKEHVLIPDGNIITEEKTSTDLLDSLSKLVIENKISEETIAEKVKEIVSALNKESFESINENLSSTVKKALDGCSNSPQEIKKIVKEAVVEAFDEIQKSVAEDCKHKHEEDDDDKKKDPDVRKVPVGNKPGDFSTENKEEEDENKKTTEEELKEAKKLFIEHLLNVAEKALKK